MKKLILILFSFITLTAFAQEDSGFTDKKEARNLMVNRLKEGKWIECTAVISRSYGNFLGGYVMDTIISANDTSLFTPKGSDWYPYYQYKFTVYRNGQIVGIQREYERTNKLRRETHYLNGKRNGIERNYYDGTLDDEVTYVDGKKEGVEKGYYPSGKLEYEYPWINGEINGIGKEYYENGKLQFIGKYRNGKDRKAKYYDEQGNTLKDFSNINARSLP